MLTNYGGTSGDIETELSAAGFGVPSMSFKPGCSNDVPINDSGVLNNGLWPNQTQRMRTYTKVTYFNSAQTFPHLLILLDAY